MNRQARALRDLMAQRQATHGPRHARTIAVTSGKRGVGKTTLAANLAIALQRAGARVALIDVDRGLAAADPALHLEPRHTLQHVLTGEATMPDVVLDGPCGVRVLPAASGLEGLANLTPWQQQRLSDGLAELERDTDLVLVDAAAGIAPEVLHVLAVADEAIVVTAPEPAAITDAYALIKVLSRLNPAATVHLLVNRVRHQQEADAIAGRVAQVAGRFLGVQVRPLGFVLEDPEVPRAVRERVAFVTAFPRCPAARCVAAVAARLLGPGIGAAKASLADRIRQLSILQAQQEQAV